MSRTELILLIQNLCNEISSSLGYKNINALVSAIRNRLLSLLQRKIIFDFTVVKNGNFIAVCIKITKSSEFIYIPIKI